MQDLNALFYYVQVVDHGGFAQAGRALGIPKSKLSRKISQLEEQLGVRLIQRSTRRFTVTEVGQDYYRHCKAMIVEAEAAQEAIDLTRTDPCGIIRLTCPGPLLEMSVNAMLAEFMARYPRVELHLEATSRRVDVVGEGVDIAIRVRPGPIEDSDLVMRVLGERGQSLVASPVLLKQLGAPKTPVELTRFPSLELGVPESEHAWTLFSAEGAQETVRHKPRFITRDIFALRAAAVAGVGIVQLPLMTMRDEIKSGELVRILPDWAPHRDIVHAVFASRRGLLPSVRALIDFLAEKFEAIDEG
jgi:DNA-binding transcriptional LysR family regulator